MEKLAKIVQVGDKWKLYTKDGTKVLGTHFSREDALKQERAIQMSKHASPRWAREFERLSKGAKDVLMKLLSPGQFRQTGKNILGEGAYSRVYPGVSSAGESAIKVLEGSQAGPSLSSAFSVKDTLKVMNDNPDLFAKIHGVHNKGYALERLDPKLYRLSPDQLNSVDVLKNRLNRDFQSSADTATHKIMVRGQSNPIDMEDVYRMGPQDNYTNVGFRPDGRAVIYDPVFLKTSSAHTDLSRSIADAVNNKLASIKEASPRLAKVWNRLSEAAKQQIIKSLPASETRQIGKKYFGFGMEGAVYPGVTGQKGPSAIKKFYDRPPTKENGFAAAISGGAGNMSPITLGGATIQDRINLFKNYPQIFPKVYGQHGRGYIMEQLEEVSAKRGLWQKLKDFMNLNSLKSNIQRASDTKRPDMGYLDKFYASQSFPVKLKGAPPIADFEWARGLSGPHNLMRAKDGRIVISDPVLLADPPAQWKRVA